jgi:hypothetical protein
LAETGDAIAAQTDRLLGGQRQRPHRRDQLLSQGKAPGAGLILPWQSRQRHTPLGGFVFRRSGCAMTDEQLAAMHKLLAEYHRRLAKEAVLDVVQQYHSDLAQRLSDEAALIPRRTAIVERLHEREQREKDKGE